LLFEIVHMNEEATRWQLVTSANPASALLPGRLSLLAFVGRAAFAYAPGELTQQMPPASFAPKELLRKTFVHSLFVQSRWAGAELGRLVKQELSPYSRDGEMRTQIDGPTVMLKQDVAQAIAVALHELATNAAKYGALSEAEGRVRVEWSRETDGRLVMRWTELGGPPVKPPTRKGFGTHVMEAMIRGHEGGDVRLDWRAEGLACEIVIPT
jgi:hypothetical protein